MPQKVNTRSWLAAISIRSQRSRAYLEAALALTTLIPMLCFCIIMLSLFTDLLPDSTLLRVGVGVAGSMVGAAGYMMLRVYPANLEKLRDYLMRLAAEDLPTHAELLSVEQDFSDIEHYLNEVIGGLRKRIVRLDEELERSRRLMRTIEKQSAEIVLAERQRVMLESLGAACHHIGQPTTVLSLYLSRLRDQHGEKMNEHDFGVCLQAVDSISIILKKLMRISEYRTVPYATFHREDGAATESEQFKILDIEQEQQGQVLLSAGEFDA